ncbi:MAG TPA: glycine zipper 2TM domain-containing protein [Burkholderiales bacterium]
MDNAPSARMHPLMSAATISVIVVSVAGVGALTGLLPRPATAPVEITPPAAAAPAPVLPKAAPAVAAPQPSASVAAPALARKPVVRTESWPTLHPAVHREVRPVADPASASPAVIAQAPVVAPPAPPAATPQPPVIPTAGTVESVRMIEQSGDGTGLGAVAGGVAGAVLGKQLGNGSGRTVMTVIGAAGGAYAGHQAEKKVRTSKRWEILVRMDDGAMRTLPSDSEPVWRTGDRVRVVNGALTGL